MSFDEAIDMIDVNGTLIDTLGVLQALQQEYAPTVEMTKEQRDIIIRLLDDSDIGRDDWDSMINDDSPELPEISYRQAIMAYMNPETIKAVYE